MSLGSCLRKPNYIQSECGHLGRRGERYTQQYIALTNIAIQPVGIDTVLLLQMWLSWEVVKL